MVHGILNKFKPPRDTTEDIAGVGIGTILGSFNQLGDVGVVGNTTSRLDISDTVDTDVTRGRPPRTHPDFKWDIFPDREPDRDKPRPILDVPFPGEPPGKDTPILPQPEIYTTQAGEAFQARDTLTATVQRGNTTNEPIVVKRRVLGPNMRFRMGDAVSYKGHKKYYVTVERHQYDTGKPYRKNVRVPPCTALKNSGFDIENRRHRKTGNSSARLRQIRRTYAYKNC